MTTRNVVLTDRQDAMIDHLVASGRYQNASEAMRAGLRLLEREEAELDLIVSRVAAGLAEVERGAHDDGAAAIHRAFAAALPPE